MRTTHVSLGLCAIAAAVALFTACKKDPDSPEVHTIPTGSVITLDSLRGLFTGTTMHFDTTDWSVYATVTADETNGNLYKEVYVQDGNAAINMRLLTSGGLYQGDRIRIYLPGTILSSYNGMLQLDNVDVDNNVVKQDVDVWVEPTLVTIAQVNSSLQGRLIRIDSVEFVSSEICFTYADAPNQQSVDRYLSDCTNQIIVRTSGYANFAGPTIASGNGSFTGIVGQYNSTMQLLIRDLNEVALSGPRCDPIPVACPATANASENFASVVDNVNISISCWSTLATAGTRVWQGGAFGTELFAEASAYTSSDPLTQNWLISPAIQANGANTLQFLSQRAYSDAGYEPFALFISTDFNGGCTGSQATWTPVTCTYADPSAANFAWVDSGVVPLTGFLPPGYTGSFVIGFRYTGNGGDAGQDMNYRIDDVQIQ